MLLYTASAHQLIGAVLYMLHVAQFMLCGLIVVAGAAHQLISSVSSVACSIHELHDCIYCIELTHRRRHAGQLLHSTGPTCRRRWGQPMQYMQSCS